MNTIQELMHALDRSKTAYHAAACAAEELEKKGFSRLEESEEWSLVAGGKYYVIRDGSALIAFCIGQRAGGFRVVASHLDSPCLKVKGNAVTTVGGCAKLNVERYGGGLNYSWLDIPLCLAGRVVSYDEETGRLSSHLLEDGHRVVIPSLAIHFNREANSGLTLNPQIDLQPVVSLDEAFKFCLDSEKGKHILERDLFLANATEPYLAGFDEELLVAPRIDNLTSAFASVAALGEGYDEGVALIYLADNEEVGSRTKQGAGSDFLYAVMARVANATGQTLETILPQSFMVSCDNAHAIHPNHPEKSDPTNPVKLGGGVVIKHHANQNYTTDAFSSAVFKAIMNRAGVAYQDFYMRADMPCGGTLGAISSSQVSIRSVDIGLPQLAMHSATETMCVRDYTCLIEALKAFFETSIRTDSYQELTLQ
ncbi:MAG: M18 family aminopeptidase [Clostridia bacterium]|nr:M18 family aminopeptidase [Clostridia bacterium]